MIFPRPESLQPSHVITNMFPISPSPMHVRGVMCAASSCRGGDCVSPSPAETLIAILRDVAETQGPVAQGSGDGRRCPTSNIGTVLATIVFCSLLILGNPSKNKLC